MKKLYKHESKVSIMEIERLSNILNDEYFVRTIVKEMVSNIPIEDLKNLFTFQTIDPRNEHEWENARNENDRLKMNELKQLMHERRIKLTAKIEI